MRQAQAAQASVHVPNNMASKRQLTTLGYYGNSPPPSILWPKRPSRLSKPHHTMRRLEGKSHLCCDHIKKAGLIPHRYGFRFIRIGARQYKLAF